MAAPTNTAANDTSEIVPRLNVSISLMPTTLDEAWRIATALSKSSLVPPHFQNKPENVLAMIFMANDLGISATQALREIYVVEGKPSSSALLKVALVQQSSACETWDMIESTSTQATFETKRRGRKAVRLTYTLDDAREAKLLPAKPGSNWDKRPKLMLRRRCASELADEVYPDVVKGLRTEDEIEEIQASVVHRDYTPRDFSGSRPLPSVEAVPTQAPQSMASTKDKRTEESAPAEEPTAHDPQTGEVEEEPSGPEAHANRFKAQMRAAVDALNVDAFKALAGRSHEVHPDFKKEIETLYSELKNELKQRLAAKGGAA